MLALLDSFEFELKGTKNRTSVDFKSLQIDESYEFVEHKKIDAFSSFQDVSKHAVKFRVSGVLLIKKIKSLDPLSEIAKKKKKVTFAIGTGEVTEVIVKSIKKSREHFSKDGSFFKQTFDLELQEVLV